MANPSRHHVVQARVISDNCRWFITSFPLSNSPTYVDGDPVLLLVREVKELRDVREASVEPRNNLPTMGILTVIKYEHAPWITVEKLVFELIKKYGEEITAGAEISFNDALLFETGAKPAAA